MRPIIISGAMESEINHFLYKMGEFTLEEIAGYKFYIGKINNISVVISKTNIGMSNVASATSISILKYNPICIINQGTAGSHSRDVHRGDIVIGVNAVNINSFEKDDMNYQTWKHADFSEHDSDSKSCFMADNTLVEIFKNIQTDKIVHFGTIGAGDVWNKDIGFIDFLNSNFKTLCEDMESASFYNVCNRFNVPSIGIRVISNNEILGEEYDKNSSCQEFIMSALANVYEIIKKKS